MNSGFSHPAAREALTGGFFAPAHSERFAAMLAGEHGSLDVSLDLYESSVRGEEGPLMDAMTASSVTLDNYRDWAWELSCEVSDNRGLDPYSVWVKAVLTYSVDVFSDRPRQVRFDCGLYRFGSPQNSHLAVTSTALTGTSPESLLAEDHEEGGYLVPAGSGVLNAARVLMGASGIPLTRISFPQTDVTLPTPVWFDPDQDAASVNKLNIVNTLLQAGGFENLYTTADGVFTTRKLIELAEQEPEVFYTSESDLYVNMSRGQLLGENLVSTEAVDDNYDDENFANKITVQSGDTNQIPPVRVTAVNDDPSSPFSTVNRPVKAAPIMVLDTVASTSEAYLIARLELQKANGYYRTLSFDTPTDPRRGPKEAAMLHATLFDGSVFATGKWRYLGFELTETTTKHQLARIEGAPEGIHRISELGPASRPNFVYGDGAWANHIRFVPRTFTHWGQEDIGLDEVEETFEELDALEDE